MAVKVNGNQTNQQQNITQQNNVNQQVVAQPQNNNSEPTSKNIQTEFGKQQEKKKSIKMIRYKYKVKDSSGKIIESYFDAENKLDVQSFLLNKGYEIVSITEDKLSTSLGLVSMSSSKKMTSKDLNFFLTQLSTYVKAIPLLHNQVFA